MYKETLHEAVDPQQGTCSSQTSHAGWLPMRDEDGVRKIDPNGLLFMSEDVVVDLKNPASPEPWKRGDVGEAEGLKKKDVWKKRKVLSDIIEHRMLCFSPEEQDQWRCIKQFHQRYQISDEVPNLPLSLKAGVCYLHKQ